MIEYENQFKMLFSIGDFTDFLVEEDLFLLKLITINTPPPKRSCYINFLLLN